MNPARTILATVFLATPLGGQSAAAILGALADKQQQRWSTVDNYTVVQRFQAKVVPLYYEKFSSDGQALFRLVPQPEWERRRLGLSGEEVVGIAEGMATGLDLLGQAPIREGAAGGDAMIQSMTGEMAWFLRQAKNFDEEETRRDAAGAPTMAAEFARRARVVERVTIDGRQAVVIRADGLENVPMPQQGDGPDFRLDTVTLWIDTEEHVPLRLQMVGRFAGGNAPLTIELHERNYQQFGALYEPTNRLMRITGMMEASATDPATRRELAKSREAAAKARADLERMDAQLAQMPVAQRRLIEGRFAQARRQLESLVNDDLIEVEMGLDVIGVNAGPPFDFTPQL